MPIIRRSKLYYTASGIITPVGGHPMHRLREDWFSEPGYQVINQRVSSVLQVARYTKIHIQYNIIISRKS